MKSGHYLHFLLLSRLVAGGFEHILQLRNLQHIYDGFWEAFDDLPPEIAAAGLQEKMAYLRDRLEESGGPLM